MYGETAFELERPPDLAGVLASLADGPAEILAGGTNLIVDLRARRVRPHRVISVDRVEELRGITTRDGRLELAARTTVSDLLRYPGMARYGPSVLGACRRFAGLMVRNAATVAGNIACGSPAADLVPPLLTLDAEITLASRAGSRTLPLADYHRDYKRDCRRADEIITAISWRRPPDNSWNRFYKLARRIGDAITVTGVAVLVSARDGCCDHARIALGAVAPTPFRVRQAEALLEGRSLTPSLIASAAEQAAEACRPIDDVRASAAYRRHTVEVLVRRLVSDAWRSLSERERAS